MSKRKRGRAGAAQAVVPRKRAMPKKGSVFIAAAAVGGVALVIATFSWPGASSGGLTASAKPQHGKVLYKQYCASCHGSVGQGELDWKYKEHGAPPLDSSAHAWHHEDAQLVSMILDKPRPDSPMPPWRGILSRDDVIDLVAYIKTLWTPFIRDNCQGAKHMQCSSTH